MYLGWMDGGGSVWTASSIRSNLTVIRDARDNVKLLLVTGNSTFWLFKGCLLSV